MRKSRLVPVIRRQALASAAKLAQKHFLNSFKKQGFTDATLRRWQQRKSDTGRPILTGSQARLKKSIRIRKIAKNYAIVGTRGIKYASIHNTGGETHPRVTEKMRSFAWYKYKETGDPKWKAIALTEKTSLTVPIPKREYIGESKVLNKATEKVIRKQFLKLFKP